MKKNLVLLFLLFAGTALWGQTSSFMDQLLKSSNLTWGQASYLVLVASNNLAEDVTEQRSFDLLKQLKWAPANTSIDAAVSLQEYAFLLMKSFGIHGGMWYSLFPGPRYAFRELTYRMILSPTEDPDTRLDGTRAIRILGRVMDVWGSKNGANG
ncbi:MAG: hypothetical protein HKM06_03560 [Spirochaetales bacterium]|nr:hypothetical protein [Spirochaetales bacterium]